MVEIKAAVLPMDEQQWEAMNIKREGSSLFTTISIVEGESLEFLEGKGEISLTEILGQLNWPDPIVMISVGGLIREELIAARRKNNFILLSKRS